MVIEVYYSSVSGNLEVKEKDTTAAVNCLGLVTVETRV